MAGAAPRGHRGVRHYPLCTVDSGLGGSASLPWGDSHGCGVRSISWGPLPPRSNGCFIDSALGVGGAFPPPCSKQEQPWCYEGSPPLYFGYTPGRGRVSDCTLLVAVVLQEVGDPLPGVRGLGLGQGCQVRQGLVFTLVLGEMDKHLAGKGQKQANQVGRQAGWPSGHSLGIREWSRVWFTVDLHSPG